MSTNEDRTSPTFTAVRSAGVLRKNERAIDKIQRVLVIKTTMTEDDLEALQSILDSNIMIRRAGHHRLRATARSGTTTTVLTSRCSRRRPSFQRWQHARWPSRKLMARGRLCLLATGYNAVPADARRRVAACVELPSWHAE